MYTLRPVAIGMASKSAVVLAAILAVGLAIAPGPVLASSNDDSGNATSSSGGTSMMGSGTASMMGSGSGWMAGRGSSGPQQSGDDYLDRLGDRISERYQLMQRIASEKDETARRNLVRQYVQAVHGGHGERDPDGDACGRGQWHGWRTPMGHGYGAMPYGQEGYGMMGPWMMGRGVGPGMGYGRGYGMGYGMMGHGPGGYGHGMMGSGMMGYGAGGYGMMAPGMTGYGSTAYGRMPDRLSDEQLDRIAEQMADSHAFRQQLAQTTDKSERRELLRKHFENLRKRWESAHQAR